MCKPFSKKKFLLHAENIVCELHNFFPSVLEKKEHLINVFHIVEKDRWFYYLNNIAKFRADEKTSAFIEGITHDYGSSAKIGINKAFHTHGTVVHELIHYYSHALFRSNFGYALNEGVTELFTRKVMKLDSARVNEKGVGDIYSRELSRVKELFADEGDLDVLSKAYFSGDLKAVQLVKLSGL